MRRSTCLSALVVLLTTPAICQLNYGGMTYVGQPDPPIVVWQIAPAPCGPTEFFAEHHIALTKNSLLAALQDPDPQVRMVSARQLVCKNITDSIPALTQALRAEKVDWVKLDLAMALTRMGDENGWRSLGQQCDDPSLPIATRLAAAEYLLRLHKEPHSETFIAALSFNWMTNWSTQADRDRDTRIWALRLVRYLPNDLSPEASTEIRNHVMECLKDSDPMVRVEASTTLRLRGDVSAVPSLEMAVITEVDDQARTWIAYNLNALLQEEKDESRTPTSSGDSK